MKRTFETFTFIDQNNIRFRGKTKFANAKQTNAKAHSKREKKTKQRKQIQRNLAGRQCESAWSACGCSKSRGGCVGRGR